METIIEPLINQPVSESIEANPQTVTFEYRKERERFDDIIAKWADETRKVKNRREIRENKRNVQEERKKGTILSDETIIPDRTVNTNIRRSRGPFVNYVTKGQKILLFSSIDRPGVRVESLEEWFATGMRYPGWKAPWIRAIDSMHTHGGCAMEVVADPNKPFHCCVEYIPRESLLFPLGTKNIQAQPRILRCFEFTVLELEEFTAKYGFSEAEVKKIMDKYQDKDDYIKVYRALMKKDGIVYNAWYNNECDDWLKPPVPHDIGLFDFDKQTLLAPTPEGVPLMQSSIWPEVKEQFAIPLQLKEYPIFWLPYEITENEVILEGQGRVALDLHVQEALTELFSSTVNAANRASKLYASAASEPGSDPELRELGAIKPGMVMSHGVNFQQFPWPNPIILAVIQALNLTNAEDAGNTDFAAMARKDANKTKYELELGKDQASETTETSMELFSTPVLDVFVLCYNIANHQAIFGLIPTPPDINLLFGSYNCQASGDVEVLKRMRDDQNAKELFNILKGSPLGEKILMFLIRRFFPDQAEDWIGALAGPNKDAVIAQFVEILSNLPIEKLELTPDQISALRNIIATASSMVEQPGNQPPAGIPGQPPAGPAPEGDAAPQASY